MLPLELLSGSADRSGGALSDIVVLLRAFGRKSRSGGTHLPPPFWTYCRSSPAPAAIATTRWTQSPHSLHTMTERGASRSIRSRSCQHRQPRTFHAARGFLSDLVLRPGLDETSAHPTAIHLDKPVLKDLAFVLGAIGNHLCGLGEGRLQRSAGLRHVVPRNQLQPSRKLHHRRSSTR